MYSLGCKGYTTASIVDIKLKKVGSTVNLNYVRTWDYWTDGWINYTTTALPAGKYQIDIIPKW